MCPDGESRRRNRPVLGAFADARSGLGILAEIIPEFGPGAGRLLSYEVLELRKKLGRRIVFCRISFRDKSRGKTINADLVVKVCGSGRRTGAFQALRLLRQAGFRGPGTHLVPRPYGYSPELNVLVQERLPGTAWADVLGEDEGTVSVASARAADWLVRLHGCGVVAPSGGRDDGTVARGMARELAARFSDHAPRLGAVAGRLIESLGWAYLLLVPSHGDYHPENVLLTPASTAAIDFDRFGRREAAHDAGYAIGQLLIMSHLRLGGFGAGAQAALAFWERYGLGDEAGWSRVATHVARTFLQSLHFELCVLGNGRVDLFGPWIGSMETFLNADGPETLEDLIRHR
jgi:hypothetical protein